MKNNRTKNFQMRITSDEYEWLKEKSASYTSVTHFVRSALAEYPNINAKQRLELINELGLYYRKVQNELSWAGGNLNQSIKRANELAVAGLLAPSYVQEVLFPSIQNMQDTINEIKRELDKVTKLATKLK